MNRKTIGLVLIVAVSLGACVGWLQGGGGTDYERYRISEAEIVRNADQVRNLYQLIERLRPHWLDADVVYQDQTRLGGLDTLAGLSPDYARSMEYLDASQAGAQLPGISGLHVAGAIVIYR